MRIKIRLFALCLSILPVWSGLAFADGQKYYVSEGKFYTDEGEVPAACLGQLKIDLNGDDTVAAIYLNRTVLRGCIAANRPYPGGNEDAISYEIVEALSEDTFKVRICEAVDGSLRASCTQVLLKFVNRKYFSPDGDINVLSLEKVGEW